MLEVSRGFITVSGYTPQIIESLRTNSDCERGEVSGYDIITFKTGVRVRKMQCDRIILIL
mgnify:CR=1 FL=1